MLEAYKKGWLCSLIEFGELPRVPKYTSTILRRHVKSASCIAYQELSEAFLAHDINSLRAALEKHSSALQADHNFGLAKQCIDALKRRNILRLTRTYLTLSLENIAEQAQLDLAEAEKYVYDMMSSGEICASIDEQQGMVRFNEWEERFDSQSTVNGMEQSIGRAIALAQKLQEMNLQLAVDHNYLSRVSSQDRSHSRWEDDVNTTLNR